MTSSPCLGQWWDLRVLNLRPKHGRDQEHRLGQGFRGPSAPSALRTPPLGSPWLGHGRMTSPKTQAKFPQLRDFERAFWHRIRNHQLQVSIFQATKLGIWQNCHQIRPYWQKIWLRYFCDFARYCTRFDIFWYCDVCDIMWYPITNLGGGTPSIICQGIFFWILRHFRAFFLWILKSISRQFGQNVPPKCTFQGIFNVF